MTSVSAWPSLSQPVKKLLRVDLWGGEHHKNHFRHNNRRWRLDWSKYWYSVWGRLSQFGLYGAFIFPGSHSVCVRPLVSPASLNPLCPCFPTVIDSSLQSLTAAHQHLLKSGEMEKGACACRRIGFYVPKLVGKHEEFAWGEVLHLTGCFRVHIHRCRCLVCRCFMVRGLREHLIMQLTWVPWFVAMVIARGAGAL